MYNNSINITRKEEYNLNSPTNFFSLNYIETFYKHGITLKCIILFKKKDGG